MIEVEHLTKKYAGVEAVRNISFHVEKGEIVGFLGPNGAGKSTTMRILAGYLPASSGNVKVAECDLLTQSLELRKKIGYMPENVPLYKDMSVQDFLSYRAALKGVRRKQLRSSVNDAMDRCAVADVRKKHIAKLSRGFRQRVALADALVHDPELLILDEPTAGLDPKQIRSVRDLIKELGTDHTILLSTHILSEVEAMCSRAIIINKGKIEASDSIQNLQAKVEGGALILEIKTNKESALRALNALEAVAVTNVLQDSEGWLKLECLIKPGKEIRGPVDQLIKDKNWDLREFRMIKASLEDVFVELTEE
ncbi:MAG: ATP-binding cassette domain-containing protein [Verrucomicrobiota bacterium]